MVYLYYLRSHSDSISNVLLALTGVVGYIITQGREGDNMTFILDLVDGCTSVLSGNHHSVSSLTTVVVQAVLGSGHAGLSTAVVLCLPVLVDAALALHWQGLTDVASHKMSALVIRLIECFDA